MYDLIIKNATIIDGTGAAPYTGDVAVKDGKIAAIGEYLEGADKLIDATGLTVTPGFIDSHSHSDRMLKAFPNQREKIEQGITLSITGQCGFSQAPKVKDGVLNKMSDFVTDVKDRPIGSSAALLIGHNTLRTAVMGKVNRPCTPEELQRMEELVQEAMDAGAIGLSFGLFYVPGCYAPTDEAIALAKVVARNNGVIAAHIRCEDDNVIESVKEFINISVSSGCRAVFSHHKAHGFSNFGKTKETLALINEANENGADLYLDAYPYIASHTTMLARFVPKAFHPEGTTNALSLLDDPAIVADIKRWAEQWNNDLSWTLVTKCSEHPEYEGMNVNEIAELRGDTDRMDTVFSIIRETKGGAEACFFLMCEEDVENVLKHPRTMIGTDSAVAGKSRKYHPRLRATFPRVLARYVRERGIVPLLEMIRKMTSLPADVYRLPEKGRLLVGKDADLCIFDADEIEDVADFVHCERKNKGLCYVIVDGEIVVENNEFNGIRRGKIYLRG